MGGGEQRSDVGVRLVECDVVREPGEPDDERDPPVGAEHRHGDLLDPVGTELLGLGERVLLLEQLVDPEVLLGAGVRVALESQRGERFAEPRRCP